MFFFFFVVFFEKIYFMVLNILVLLGLHDSFFFTSHFCVVFCRRKAPRRSWVAEKGLGEVEFNRSHLPGQKDLVVLKA